MAGNKRYLDLLDSMKELHVKKNAGYAGMDAKDSWANFRMSEQFGVSAFKGCLVRMSDKYIRVTNLVKNPANDQVGENIKDTLFDLAAYALIAICLLEEKNSQVSQIKESLKEIQFDNGESANKLRLTLEAELSSLISENE